jgi:hypothetical protein
MEKRGEIIVFGKAVVDRALVDWLKGNREQDKGLIEKASERLDMYKEIYPIAKYFGGIAKIQLRDDGLEENLANVFQVLEQLLDGSELDSGQLLRSCREMLHYLSTEDEFFRCNYEMPLVPTLEEIKQVVVEINTKGIEKPLLAEAYAYIDAYLSR